ncbi:DNA repair protein rhp57 [Talaromyces islandicus]|uniref:DNA repair protein rhp57 n=1 Tax=Talaromyces islandicus TaxID=28573 RepID=A0A0U1M3Z7_TALIS|nr:DNA repair protein rhp57 [Talaromyces islandicus]
MDLLSVLPDFSTKSYSHILPPLERKHISTVDLITLDTLEIAKRAHVPPADVRRLSADVVAALHASLGWLPKKDDNNDNDNHNNDEDDARNKLDLSRWNTISTLDATLDELLGGGIPTGYLTEITGESGSGKTQFLLNLLLAAQLAPPHGIGKTAIYISTEAPLSTPRLSQLLQKHPYLSSLPEQKRPSLAKVLSITAVDLETQDHILNYQLPVAISRFNVGLVVIDSITANYRAEHASNNMQALSARSGELAKLGHMLRNLAASEDVAIVVANQVSDRFDSLDGQQQQQGRTQPGPNRSLPRNRIVEDTPSSSPATQSSQLVEDDAFDGGYLIGHPVRNETLTLAYQEKFFTGWGDDNSPGVSDYYVSEVQKTPALGLVWSTQIACRIVLKKDDEVDPARAAAAAAVASSQPVHPGISTARNYISSPLGSSSSKDSQNENEAATPRKPSLSQPALSTSSTSTPTTTSAPAAATPDTKRKIKRRMKLVFAPWAPGIVKDSSVGDGDNNNTDEVEFEIWQGGIKSVVRNEELGNV